MLSRRLISHANKLPALLRGASCRQARNFHAAKPKAAATSGLERFVKVSEEVRDALATGKPVVALESTIYTHGFPYPENVALAKSLESIVRKEGAVPATIGVIDGVARVGLEGEDLPQLASAGERGKVLKVSRRDLGYILGLGLRGKGIYGGTTVAGTSVLANMAGIKVFATGGLGGVHRNGEITMDVSADLTEMGRTPIAVVCSGCKSFLDIPRTLEYLETEGVMVGVFADGRTGNIDFPAFYSRDSGIKAPKVIEDEADAAAMIYAQRSLNLSSGLIFANPVPEGSDLRKEEMDVIINKALEEARRAEVLGSDNTPFVLAKIKELSNGRSVKANTALVEANALRGARVAVELARLEKGEEGLLRDPKIFIPAYSSQNQKVDGTNVSSESDTSLTGEHGNHGVIVAGSVAIDFSCDFTPFNKDAGITPALHVSNPSAVKQSLGGVGHNVARAVHYMKTPVTLCSVVSDDFGGRTILTELQRENVRTNGIQVLDPEKTGKRTAQYVAVNDANKDLMVAMADMTILETSPDQLRFKELWEPLLQQDKPSWMVIDANWSSETIAKWATLAKQTDTKIAIESVSAPKSARLFAKDNASTPGSSPAITPSKVVPHNVIDLANPNQFELRAMWDAAREAGLFEGEEWFSVIDSFGMTGANARQRLTAASSAELVDQGIPQQSIQLLPFIPCIITKLGPNGVLLTQMLASDDPRLRAPEHARHVLGRAAPPREGVNKAGGIYMRHFPPAGKLAAQEIVSVNGVGDTLLGVLVAGLARNADDQHLQCLETIIPVAQRASIETLKSPQAVSPRISGLLEELKAGEQKK